MRAPPWPSAPPAWRRHPRAPPRREAPSPQALSSPSSASAFASASQAPVPRRCLRQPPRLRPNPGPFGRRPASAFAWAAPAWAGRGRSLPTLPVSGAPLPSRAWPASWAPPPWWASPLSLAPPSSWALLTSWAPPSSWALPPSWAWPALRDPKFRPRLQAARLSRVPRLSAMRKASAAPSTPLRVRVDRAAAIPRRRTRQASRQSQAGTILPCPRGPVEISLSSEHRVGEVVSNGRKLVPVRRRGS